jgi:hypothetical protein
MYRLIISFVNLYNSPQYALNIGYDENYIEESVTTIFLG